MSCNSSKVVPDEPNLIEKSEGSFLIGPIASPLGNKPIFVAFSSIALRILCYFVAKTNPDRQQLSKSFQKRIQKWTANGELSYDTILTVENDALSRGHSVIICESGIRTFLAEFIEHTHVSHFSEFKIPIDPFFVFKLIQQHEDFSFEVDRSKDKMLRLYDVHRFMINIPFTPVRISYDDE
jgi:hypothetical protein